MLWKQKSDRWYISKGRCRHFTFGMVWFLLLMFNPCKTFIQSLDLDFPVLRKFLQGALQLFLSNRQNFLQWSFPIGIYLFKFSNGNMRTCKSCSKLTIKTTGWRQWLGSNINIFNFEQISNFVDFEQVNAGYFCSQHFLFRTANI